VSAPDRRSTRAGHPWSGPGGAPALGLIGGIGPESTIDYYRRILALWQEVRPGTAPSILIDSLDVDEGIRLVQHDRPGLVDYLAASTDRLTRAGAELIAMAANTPHIVVDELEQRCRVPLLSIVEACAARAAAEGYGTVGLLGTRFTMEARMYPDAFARHAIEVVTPEETARAWLHERYLGELLRGVFSDETRTGVETMCAGLGSGGAEAVVLAGTELPLLLGGETAGGLPILDSTEVHVASIVDALFAGSRNPAQAAVSGTTERHREWIAAVNATDIDAYARLVTEDLVWLPPHGDPVVGRPAFRAWLEPFFEAYAYDFTIDGVEALETTGWIAETGEFVSRMTPRSGGPQASHSGRFFALWRREEGHWRMERYVDTGGLRGAD
jgi:aspartate racemase